MSCILREPPAGGAACRRTPVAAVNPVEYQWSYWKQHELANVCPQEYWRLGARARVALKRMKSKWKRLVLAFWKQAELCFD